MHRDKRNFDQSLHALQGRGVCCVFVGGGGGVIKTIRNTDCIAIVRDMTDINIFIAVQDCLHYLQGHAHLQHGDY